MAQGSGGSAPQRIEFRQCRCHSCPSLTLHPPQQMLCLSPSPQQLTDSTGSSQHCRSYSQQGNWGQCPSWTHLGQFSRLLYPVSSYPQKVPGAWEALLPHPPHSSLGIQGNLGFAAPNLGPSTVFLLALEVTGQQGLCLEGLQPVNHGAGIIYKTGEAQSCHCLKSTRDSAPSY